MVAGLLLAAAAILVSTVFDEEALRARVQETTSETLGLEVSIGGPVSLSVWPTPGISAADIVLGTNAASVASLDAVRLDIALLPLFTGDLRIRHVNVDGADIELRRDDAGRLVIRDPERGEAQAAALPSVGFSAVSVRYLDEEGEARFRAAGCGGRLPNVAIPDGTGQDAPLRGLQIEGALRCTRIEAQEFRFSEVESELSVREDSVRLSSIALQLFEGAGSGEVEGDFSGDPPRWSLRLALDDFTVEEFLQALEPEARAEGRMDFSAEVSASGSDREALERSLEGRISLGGEGLTLYGSDLDERLEDYEATQRFGLADAGALFFAGPAGLVVTRGHEFVQLLRRDDGETEIRELRSEWTLSEGVAEPADVAAATARNRLAARGRIDYAGRRFEEFTLVLLDREGCAVMEQAVRGSFEDPQIEEPGAIEAVLGPLIDLVERGLEELVDEDCEVVYDGAVSHP